MSHFDLTLDLNERESYFYVGKFHENILRTQLNIWPIILLLGVAKRVTRGYPHPTSRVPVPNFS